MNVLASVKGKSYDLTSNKGPEITFSELFEVIVVYGK